MTIEDAVRVKSRYTVGSRSRLFEKQRSSGEQSILSLSEYINYNILTTLSIVILGMRETSNVSIADSLFFLGEEREN